MTSLTTRQRDLLNLLLDADIPMGSSELAGNMQLTARQVNYDLKGLKQWLAHRDIALIATPGVGVTLTCTPEQHHRLSTELATDSGIHLVLTSEQRQQLLALMLLNAQEPLILYQLQQLAQVSRTTILKDLDLIADWLAVHDITLERRPNYGIWINSQEKTRRQAMVAWLWGETTLGQSLTQMNHMNGLTFVLGEDANLMPIVQKVGEILTSWDTKRALWQVTYAEAQLDGRFTDNAVLHLALVFAIQTQRVKDDHHVSVEEPTLNWLKTLSIWPIAAQIAKRLAWSHTITWPDEEIAITAMHILAAPRNDRWPGDLDVDNTFSDLVDELMQRISQSYQISNLREDATLRDGIVTHVIPACLRHRFQIWLPPSPETTNLSPDYINEHTLAHELAFIVWIVGHTGDEREYEFSAGLDAPATIVLTDVPASVRNLVAQTEAEVIVRDEVQVADYAELSAELTDGKGFDDIVILDPHSAEMVGEAAKLIARRGTFNLVGERPLDGKAQTDVGRLHYDYTAYIGNRGPDIAASYGEARNRCELHPHGSVVVIGAGGPMGQMHVQRAIELPNGPRLVIATEVNDVRLEAIRERFEPLAKKNGRTLLVFNPITSEESLHDFVMKATDNVGADDVVVSVPSAALMEEAAALMNPNGMLVLFAGVPNGTLAPLEVSNVYLHNTQLTGTSGLTLDDQRLVMDRALEGTLSPGRLVAAIGGMNVAPEAIEAVIEGSYPGKIVIFPQIPDLPLLGLDELEEELPEIAALLDEDGFWTNEAEEALIEKFWEGP